MIRKTEIFKRALVCGAILTAVWSFFGFYASCDTLTQSVIRLHVVANSDSSEDQELKLLVRDAVLLKASEWYGDETDFEQANFELSTNLQAVDEAADKALRENGSGQEASVQISDEFFSTRYYDSYCLPAGVYRTLKVTLGEGKGENWWCIAFPALCIPAAEDREGLLEELPPAGEQVARSPDKYRIELKSLELFEKFRNWLFGE